MTSGHGNERVEAFARYLAEVDEAFGPSALNVKQVCCFLAGQADRNTARLFEVGEGNWTPWESLGRDLREHRERFAHEDRTDWYWRAGVKSPAHRTLVGEQVVTAYCNPKQSELYAVHATAIEVDRRLTALRKIALRDGQDRFRGLLMIAYGSRCAVTGCSDMDALEAAHIDPFAGGGSMRVTNGLLLRSDIHALFDRYLLSIDTSGREARTVVSKRLVSECYQGLHGNPVQLPTDAGHGPDKAALAQHCCHVVPHRA